MKSSIFIGHYYIFFTVFVCYIEEQHFILYNQYISSFIYSQRETPP